jgi:stage IV sporulation protein A
MYGGLRMTNTSIYQDIATRTGGDIYIGVVGPVRTGKSTFIKKFMENLVIPNISNEYKRERTIDELPQSAAGKTIMTTEPKFIPDEAVQITMDENAQFNVRLIDCVGYVVEGAMGQTEDGAARMVETPWSEDKMEFQQAAEIGTRKVICEHSTIGLVLTTDGSIGEIPRDDYVEAETRIIGELKGINKPFAVLINSMFPESESARELRDRLAAQYDVPVMTVNCLELDQEKILSIIQTILLEFPIKEINVDLPGWVGGLDKNHWLKREIYSSVLESAKDIDRIRTVKKMAMDLSKGEQLTGCEIQTMDLGNGSAGLKVELKPELYYNVLSEAAGIKINNDGDLVSIIKELSAARNEYDKIKDAFNEAKSKGYGTIFPSVDEMKLSEPQLFKQGGRFGVKLSAEAPSYHIIQANICAEVSPVVGSEKQSEELIDYLLKDFEEDPSKIWDSNIFGKSVYDLVNEGLNTKLTRMPDDARFKLQETLAKIINEGSAGLICIIV